jgi:hypothetical protein
MDPNALRKLCHLGYSSVEWTHLINDATRSRAYINSGTSKLGAFKHSVYIKGAAALALALRQGLLALTRSNGIGTVGGIGRSLWYLFSHQRRSRAAPPVGYEASCCSTCGTVDEGAPFNRVLHGRFD